MSEFMEMTIAKDMPALDIARAAVKAVLAWQLHSPDKTPSAHCREEGGHLVIALRPYPGVLAELLSLPAMFECSSAPIKGGWFERDDRP